MKQALISKSQTAYIYLNSTVRFRAVHPLAERTIPDMVKAKFEFFENFWAGDGPFPILFSTPHAARGKFYLRYDLVQQHGDVEKLLEESLLQAAPHLDLIDDGIPVVRADLGTTLLPSGLGLEIVVQPELQPWVKAHLTREAVRELPALLRPDDILRNEVRLALKFYRLFFERQKARAIPPEIFPYLPDTQGVFDLSHIIRGQEIFVELLDDPDFVLLLQQRSLELYLAATSLFKKGIGEGTNAMVHGHGMPAGTWFPDTGTRISEDSCTLISPTMLKKFCLPFIRKAVEPFGRAFLHFCGQHYRFLEMACEMELISTLNLGNPEKHDLEGLFALLGKTGTAYLGVIPAQEAEDLSVYLERVAELTLRHKARLILVSALHPANPEEKKKAVERWHKLTRNPRRYFR